MIKRRLVSENKVLETLHQKSLLNEESSS
jgi:hypothetical protein